MKKITTRDLKFFFLGAISLFLFYVALDWDDFQRSFKEGVRDSLRNNTERIEAN